jgi:MFS family permease
MSKLAPLLDAPGAGGTSTEKSSEERGASRPAYMYFLATACGGAFALCAPSQAEMVLKLACDIYYEQHLLPPTVRWDHRCRTSEVSAAQSMWTLVFSAVQLLPAIVVALCLGPLSDRTGRKPWLLIGAGGALVQYTGYAWLHAVHAPLAYYLIPAVLSAFSGGFVIVLMGLFSYAADSSTFADRHKFMVRLEAFIFFGIAFGPLAGVWLSKHYGTTTVYMAGAVINAIAILYTLALPESMPAHKRKRGPIQWRRAACHSVLLELHADDDDDDDGVADDGGDASHDDGGEGGTGGGHIDTRAAVNNVVGSELDGSTSVADGETPKHRRTYARGVLAFIALAFMSTFILFSSTPPIVLLYTHLKDAWTRDTYGYWISVTTGASGVCMLAISPFLKSHILPLFKGEFNFIICCAFWSATVYAINFAAIPTTTSIFIGSAVKSVITTMVPVMRAVMSRSVPAHRQGALFSCICVLEIVGGSLGPILFTALYKVTTSSFPRAALVGLAAFHLPLLCLLFAARRRQWQWQQQQKTSVHGRC